MNIGKTEQEIIASERLKPFQKINKRERERELKDEAINSFLY